MSKLFGLIGKNISYSFSKEYFTEKFKTLNLDNHSYEVFDIPYQSKLSDVLEIPNLAGCNVTIPYKQEIITFLDDLSEAAHKIGAVNTIQFKNGKKIGHNTDAIGFKNSLIPLLESHHKKAIILGNGGASKAVEFVLNELNIEYLIISRSGNFKFQHLTSSIIESHQIIINTTPLGTFPNIDETPEIDINVINKNHFIYDLIYNPEKTLFLQEAEKNGAKIKNGLEMLHLQADAAWEIWK